MTSACDNIEVGQDSAASPGQLIQECISDMGISARELARRCGRSGKLMAEIIAGKAPIEPATALQLERVLGISASKWSNMEAAYQLCIARVAERDELEAGYSWATRFPMSELIARGLIKKHTDKASQVKELLAFFGVASARACEDRIGELLQVEFRTSQKFESDSAALAAWLRIGERQAMSAIASDYDKDAFVEALKEIRKLTLTPLQTALPHALELCANSGVIFVLEKPFSKVRASGISRWLSPRRAIIQQSLRHKSDDHFWFTFFHEAAHLLLHSRKELFIDVASGPGSGDPRKEAEANIWAASYLIPHNALKEFESTFTGTENEVRSFAQACGVSPGIVVGQLQHRRTIAFSALNHLKARYTWDEN